MKYLKIHEDFLKKHEATPRKKLAELFNAKFKVQVSIKGLSQKCRKLGLVCPNNGYFKKGSIPANKGTKGLTGANSDTLQQYRLANETILLHCPKIKSLSDTLQQYRLANETTYDYYEIQSALSDTLQQYRLANETLYCKSPEP